MNHHAQNAPAALTISGISIRQDEAGRYCLNDLHRASGGANRHRPSLWLNNQQTVDFIKELEKAGIPAFQSKQGLGTFVQEDMVYDYAMWISPAFKVKVIRAYRAMVAEPQPKPAPEPEITETLAEAIDHRVYWIGTDARQALTQRAREYRRLGHTEAETLAWLDHQPLGGMRLVRTEDLNPLADRVADLFNALSAVMDGHTEPRRGFPA